MEEPDSSPNIRVICRFRPLNQKEKEMGENTSIEFCEDNKTIIINSALENQEPLRFNFDHIFTPASKQIDVYKIAAIPTVEAVMQGFNGTVFAYGQTSSGKTFTMTGVLSDPELMGIIPRMVGTVFEKISTADASVEFSVKVAYAEIYMEKIKDLLDPSKTDLKIREDKTRGIYIEDLTDRYVGSEEEVYDLMKVGTDNREVGYTHMNAGSSRSHSIFIITITQTNAQSFSTKSGRLFLVDLAGSEKIAKTGAEGKRLEEAKMINKSLTALGQVINALTDGKSTHVPYRDSKLTRVLQDSLGGNAKTSLIITCSPSPYNEDETVSTLRFGIRAKSIKNKPKINREYTVSELKLLLAQAKEELEKKEKQIKAYTRSLEKNNIPLPEEDTNNSVEEEDKKVEVDETPSKSAAQAEVIEELEAVRTELDNQNCLVQILSDQINKIQEERLDWDVMKSSLIEEKENLEGKISEFEKEIKLKEASFSLLESQNEELQRTIQVLKQQNYELDQMITTKNFEVERYLGKSKSQEDVISDLQGQVQAEREKAAKILQDFSEIQQKLNTSSEIVQSKEIESLKYEKLKELWNEEKKSLITELQSKVLKVTDIRKDLDDTRRAFKNLQALLLESDSQLRQKNEQYLKNQERLYQVLEDMITQNTLFKLDKQASESKVNKFQEKAQKLEEEVRRYKEKLLQAELKLNTLDDGRISRIPQMKLTRNQTAQLKRTIKGGVKSNLPGIHQRYYSSIDVAKAGKEDN
ncbi:unnamed protein product [Blepharisma stoltei]|uniref:Kinesin-like protein n=1 Tax=Blepharisma stoltei TaxID=1481888 RepID=A0AAU9JMM7_9CILI|nr:unnamed protein product [Blepharisma stoltei]